MAENQSRPRLVNDLAMAGGVNRKITEYLIYLIFWGALLFSPVWGGMLGGSKVQMEWSELFEFWEFLIPAVILFFVNNNILVPILLYKRRGGYYIVYILCVVIALALVYVFSPGNVPGAKPPRDVERVLHDRPQLGMGMPGFGLPGMDNRAFDEPRMDRRPPRKRPEPDLLFVISNPGSVRILLVLFVLVFNLCVRLNFFAIRHDEKYRELWQEKLKAELDYLKYQINPHFFMNTLNNIHALIDIDKEKAQGVVLELSRMMRYVLYDASSTLVPLDKEIAFLESYVDLMKLRHTDRLQVTFDFQNTGIKSIHVPSLMFVVFVENAFKHGVSYDKSSYVHISVRVDDARDMLVFECSNSYSVKAAKFNDGYAGVGVENARKRLELLFASKASLDIKDAGGIYDVVLEIPICYDKMYNC